VPGSRQLPYVLLKGNGVAIGRGREALWATSSATSTQQPSPRAFLTAGSERKWVCPRLASTSPTISLWLALEPEPRGVGEQRVPTLGNSAPT
jgi:hypothetical protein